MITDARTEKMIQLFGKYIGEDKILVADATATSRTTIGTTLAAIGAKSAQVSLVATYEEAERAIEALSPKILICDYDLGRRCGLDLLQKLRAKNPEFQKCLFVLATGNTSQSAVARAAEEDVDTYVLKPLLVDAFRRALLQAALTKISPSDYAKAIEQGKAEIAEGKIDEATATFTRAKPLDSAPALACYYLGQIEQTKKAFDAAKTHFQEGLQHNKIHYKCMAGLFEVLMEQKRHAEAYDAAKRISQYYPANSQRLTAALRLAIMTGSYDDVERYYRVFTSIDDRNPEMVRYICAALAICGKYYLQKGLPTRALELFQKCAKTADGNPRILREVVQALVDAGMSKQAEEYLQRFPADSHAGADYQSMRFMITAQTSGPQRTLDVGQDLLTNNIHDPLVYRIMIERCFDAQLPKAGENLAARAAERWPDQRNAFDALLAKHRAAAPAAASSGAKAPAKG